MTHFDLCLPWYWEYDVEFVQMVAQACARKSLTFLEVTPANLLEATTALYKGELTLGAMLDRSQGDRRFEPLKRWVGEHFIRRINSQELSEWSEDKATMHMELIHAGLYTPFTILLPSFISEPVIPEADITPLGSRFVIKPSNGGGGEGVIMGATTWQEILAARLEFPQQKYLAQAHVSPRTLDGRPAWFRIFFASGAAWSCWWDPLTHVYGIVTPEEEQRYNLHTLISDTCRIAAICRLDWFSTEIALTDEHFVVVDYVNDGIDTRLQSRALDGVPDQVMQGIADGLVEMIREGKMTKARARGLGIPLEGLPGPWNAITDVEGVSVGFATLMEGEAARTGVTILHPRGSLDHEPVFAGTFAFNGNGEMTGAAWVEEGGMLEGPIGLTNTHSVGVVRDPIIQWQAEHDSFYQRWSCPLVAETADGLLNDMNRFHVQPAHVRAALDGAQTGPVAEGNVGGGTGMICYEFKGGTGTASRRLPPELGGWTVGALVQANFGRRDQLTVAGVPVGQYLKEGALSTRVTPPPAEQGSLIVILATDAPLLPHQLKRVARRAALGMARTGSLGGNGSGDIFLAFSTATTGTASNPQKDVLHLQALPNEKLDPLFFASVYATEEAILNAMLAAETMTGRGGVTIEALPHGKLQEILKLHNRLQTPDPISG